MDDKIKTDRSGESRGKPYETRDANFKNLMLVGLGIMGVMAVTLVFGWLISAYFTTHSANPGAPTNEITLNRPFFPAPALQAHPVLDLKDLRAREDSILTSYGWSDKKEGLVRVPISEAMNLLLRRGLPVVFSSNEGAAASSHPARRSGK